MGVAALMVSLPSFAGGLLTNTNQNVAFLRNPARDGAIGIDGVYSNPAGVSFLGAGFHLSLNIQSAYQTREVTSTFGGFRYGAGNNGATKKFKGDAQAPVIPSFQAAYNWKRWSVSAGFAIGGGGGKCEFDDGLGSFECQAALLPMLLGDKMGITRYSMDSYMRGRQYYYGFQVGAGYKINDHLSVFVGGRLVYATCNYYGYVKNIQVNVPGTETMTPASGFFKGQMSAALEKVGEYKGLAEQAAAAGNAEAAAQYAAAAVQYGEAARQMGTLGVATEDVELNCDQQDWGFQPIIGLDFKYGKWNVGAKYEFKGRLRLENRSANSASAANLSALDPYRDGNKMAADIPGLLTLGVQYEILPSLRVNAGYHHFFDKQARQDADSHKLLKNNSNEYLLGVEYDINDRWQVSAGAQSTNYGMTDAYIKDMSFNVSSTSVGLGLGVKLTERVKLNLAYFHTFYSTYDRETDDYNNLSRTVAVAAGEESVEKLMKAGALKGSDSFTRTNKVFGIGVDFKF